MIKRLLCILLSAAVMLSLCGCLPKIKLGGPKEAPFEYFEIGEKNGVTYAYKIIYDGDYTTLTEEQKQALVQTELVEVTPYKTSTIYKCDGVNKYFLADDKGKTGNCVFFYTSTRENEYSLYSYNLSTGLFQQLLSAPASQMVIPDGDNVHGWVAKDASLYAVNLENGNIDADNSYNLENSELLFYSEGQDFDRKITRLYTGEAPTIVCVNIEYYDDDLPGGPCLSYTYHFEVTTRTFIGPFENILLN